MRDWSEIGGGNATQGCQPPEISEEEQAAAAEEEEQVLCPV